MWRPTFTPSADGPPEQRPEMLAALAVTTAGWSGLWAGALWSAPGTAVPALTAFLGGLGLAAADLSRHRPAMPTHSAAEERHRRPAR